MRPWLVVLLGLVGWGQALLLKGFQCADKVLPAVVDLTDQAQICANLTLRVNKTAAAGERGRDGTTLVVEHSHLPLPGKGVVLQKADGPVGPRLSVELGSQLAARVKQACGTSFLLGYLMRNNVVLDFDVLTLRTACRDEPEMKLVVERRTDLPVAQALTAGMVDPLQGWKFMSCSRCLEFCH